MEGSPALTPSFTTIYSVFPKLHSVIPPQQSQLPSLLLCPLPSASLYRLP